MVLLDMSSSSSNGRGSGDAESNQKQAANESVGGDSAEAPAALPVLEQNELEDILDDLRGLAAAAASPPPQNGDVNGVGATDAGTPTLGKKEATYTIIYAQGGGEFTTTVLQFLCCSEGNWRGGDRGGGSSSSIFPLRDGGRGATGGVCHAPGNGGGPKAFGTACYYTNCEANTVHTHVVASYMHGLSAVIGQVS